MLKVDLGRSLAMGSKNALILVHGVGHADEGSTIKALLEGESNAAVVGQYSTLQIGEHRYRTATTDQEVDIFESNWSEARPLQSSGPKILLEALLLVLGKLDAHGGRADLNELGAFVHPGRLGIENQK